MTGNTPAYTAAVTGLRFEHLAVASGGAGAGAGAGAMGVGVANPRLSWSVVTATPGWRQSGYEVEAYAPDGGPDGVLRGRTGRIESDASVLVPWPFAPLASRERALVRVRVWDAAIQGSPDQARASAWSELAPVEAGLLHPGDWTAQFITPDWDEDTGRPQPCPLLRREFTARPGVRRARLYVTSLGVYEAQINGAVVGDHVLAPGWTSYDHRLRYQTFDVTALIAEGRNAIGAILGDGWFRGRLGVRGGRRNIYGDRLALLAQLEIEYEDGAAERIVTDGSWRAATGPILASDIYDGEIYDARLEREGWCAAGCDDSDWAGVRLVARDLATLVAPSGPPVRRTELLAPVAITTSPSGTAGAGAGSPRPYPGRFIVDFGQNLVGRLRLTVQGAAGQTITLRHAEVLEDGRVVHAAAEVRRSHRPLHPARGRAGNLGAALHLSRLPLRRDRRLAGRAAAGRQHPGRRRPGGRLPLGPGTHRLVRVLRTRSSTGSTRTWSGACAATSWTFPPTARSATSAWAGRAISRSSRPPRASCTTQPASSNRGWPTWPRSRRPRAARSPLWCPTSCRSPSGPRPPGAMPRSSCPGCCTSASATRASWPISSRACAAWVDTIAGVAGEGRLWEEGMQLRRLARPEGAAR